MPDQRDAIDRIRAKRIRAKMEHAARGMTHNGSEAGTADLARVLCDNLEAREIAGRAFAPAYDDSADDVKAYWRAIANAATSEVSLSVEREALKQYRSGDLRQTMERLSEHHWFAGWMWGLEHSLWRMAFEGGSRQFGMGEVSDEDAQRLRELAEATGLWWHWPDEADEPVTIPLADFAAIRAALNTTAEGGER